MKIYKIFPIFLVFLGMALLIYTCINEGSVPLMGDDDDSISGDDDATGDDDVTGDDDDVTGDDDDVTGDDDDATGDDDDATGDDDDDDDECTSTLDFPSYVFDSLVIEEFLESDYYNTYLTNVIAITLPPDSDETIILFDPHEDITSGSFTIFSSSFGIGQTAGTCYDFSSTGNPITRDYTLSNYFFDVEESIRNMNLYFGITLPLHDVWIGGEFSPTYDSISNGVIRGGFLESDARDLEFMGYQVYEFLDGRAMNYDYDGNGVMDGWTLVIRWTAYQFL